MNWLKQLYLLLLLASIQVLICSPLAFAEPVTSQELREMTKYPIPCHEIEAFHFTYGLANKFHDTKLTDINPVYGFTPPLIYGIRSDKAYEELDLSEQDYADGEKYVLVPQVDISDSGQHGSTIKNWIVYRARKARKPIRSYIGKDPSLLLVFEHPQYEFYSKERHPRNAFGFIKNASQKPYLSKLYEFKTVEVDAEPNFEKGTFEFDWNSIRVVPADARYTTEYVVSEICYPVEVIPAHILSDQGGACSDHRHPPMSTDINDYTRNSDSVMPTCLARLKLLNRVVEQIERNLDAQELLLKGVLEALPIVGDAYTATQCESLEDYRCWGEVGVGLCGSAGGLLSPLTKGGKFIKVARVAGKILIGVEAAGNVALAIDDLANSRGVSALARVVGIGFNVAELRVSSVSGKKVLGARKAAAEPPSCATGVNGPQKTKVFRDGIPAFCDVHNIACQSCSRRPFTEIAESEVDEFLSLAEKAQILARRASDFEKRATADNVSTIDEILAFSEGADRVRVQVLDDIEVSSSDLNRWAEGATTPLEAAEQIERGFRDEILDKLDQAKQPLYDRIGGESQIKLARIKVVDSSGTRVPNIDNPNERALRDIENKISGEEFDHYVGRHHGKGYGLDPTTLYKSKRYYPHNPTEIKRFLCWLEAMGDEDLVKLMKEQLQLAVRAADEREMVNVLSHQIDEVDRLINMQKRNLYVTDAFLDAYDARVVYSYWKQGQGLDAGSGVIGQ